MLHCTPAGQVTCMAPVHITVTAASLGAPRRTPLARSSLAVSSGRASFVLFAFSLRWGDCEARASAFACGLGAETKHLSTEDEPRAAGGNKNAEPRRRGACNRYDNVSRRCRHGVPRVRRVTSGLDAGGKGAASRGKAPHALCAFWVILF